jgi:hypothetical protein
MPPLLITAVFVGLDAIYCDIPWNLATLYLRLRDRYPFP